MKKIWLKLQRKLAHGFWFWTRSFIACVAVCLPPLAAEEIQLEWDPNSEADLAGYRLYFGAQSGVYSDVMDVGDQTIVAFAISNDWETYYFAVTAYNVFGLESDYSNEVAYAPVSTEIPNTPPNAEDDVFIGIQQDSAGNALAVLLNDSDPDGDPLTLSSVSAPDQGGSLSIQASQINYTPAPGFYGSESFSYSVSDGQGGSDQALVSVSVTKANEAPVASDDVFTGIQQDSAGNALAVLANDTDPDGDSLTLSSVSAPDQGGSVSFQGSQINYTPAPGFYGSESFSYSVSDGQGGSDQALVSVSVTKANEAPVASDDVFTGIQQDSAGNALAVLLNDSDPDGDPLTLSSVSAPDQGGSVSIQGSQINYTPAPGFYGSESFSYSVSDGQGGSDQALVSVEVSAIVSPMLVPRGSLWRYLDEGTNQAGAWRDPGFNDASWASGLAQLGYGEGDEATTVSYGSDWKNKHTTTYFRHAFDVGDPSAYESLEISLMRDDGAVVYLNGVEIVRSNMPEGAITYTTNADSSSKKSNNIYLDFLQIDSSVLTAGTNVLAVEVHLSRNNNRICSFDLELRGVLKSSQTALFSAANSQTIIDYTAQYRISNIDGQPYFTVVLNPNSKAAQEISPVIVEYSKDLKSWLSVQAMTREINGAQVPLYAFPAPISSESVGFMRLRTEKQSYPLF